MKSSRKGLLMAAVALCLGSTVIGEQLPNDIKAKGEVKIKALKSLGSDPQVVNAVKAYNENPPADSKAMTNEKWKGLSVLDPFVRSFSKNPLGEYLKTKKDETVSEMFVSGADGCKVAFLAKTTNWTHKGKPKHEVPMTGETYIGPVEIDESSGQQQFQVGLPVLDGGKPIGSIVIGLKVSALR